MEKDKNTDDMSVDELLRRLKDGIAGNENTPAEKTEATPSQNSDDVAEKVSDDAEVGEETAAQEENAPEENAEDDVRVFERPIQLSIDDAAVPEANSSDSDDIEPPEEDDAPTMQWNTVGKNDDAETAKDAAAPSVEHKVFRFKKVSREAANDDAEDTKVIDTNPEKKIEFDDKDVHLRIALGLDKEVREEVGDENMPSYEDVDTTRRFGFDKHRAAVEYTDDYQTEDIRDAYRKKRRGVVIRLVLTAVMTLALFVLENISLFGVEALPGVFDKLTYPGVFVMICTQLLVWCAALAYPHIIDGAKSFAAFKPTSGSIILIVSAFTVIYDFVIFFMGAGARALLYNFPAALCIFIAVLFEYYDIKREMFSFDIVSSKKPKHIVSAADGAESALEVNALEGFINDDDPLVLRVGKCSFVEKYFARTDVRSGGFALNLILIPLIAAAMIAFFAASAIKGGVIAGFESASVAMLFGLPMIVFLTNCYPLYKASKKAHEHDCAIVGEGAIDEYAGASVVSFEDKDAFPSFGVKVKSIHVYGNARFDHVLYNAASAFGAVGGPLCDVFDLATVEFSKSEDVELVNSLPGGIEVSVDGNDICIGKASYMEQCGVAVRYNDEDNFIDPDTRISTMYLSENGVLSAKFYIQYNVDADFEFILKQLAKSGICAVVKTFDPNINDELLAVSLDIAKYPIKVIACSIGERVSEDCESADSGIVSCAGTKELLSSVIMCDRLSHVLSINKIVKIISTAVGILIMTFLAIFGSPSTVSSFFVALYQAFWIIPTLLITKLYL